MFFKQYSPGRYMTVCRSRRKSYSIRILSAIQLMFSKPDFELNKGVRIIKIDRDTTPFSFFNFVFIDKKNTKGSGMKEMLAHEMEHVRQRHSFDVLILELLTIIQWFNPFIWLLKRSIRENHEFLADNGVLKPEVSSAAYRMLLLNSAFIQQPVIANNFNYSLIKIRIKMITKIKSSKTAALKFSLGILVTAAMLVIFAFDIEKNQVQDKKTTDKQAKVTAKDQQKSTQTNEKIFIVAQQMPVFPGGDKAFPEFIGKEVKYPDNAKKAGIQGKVYVKFVINKEGNVVNSKIVRSASPSLNEEALRVINNMPKWTPGKQDGKNVDVQLTVPIAFVLN